VKVLPRFREPTEVVRTETQWKRVGHLAGNSETAGTFQLCKKIWLEVKEGLRAIRPHLVA